eukprot:2824343-Prymnesium_polylepis.1
MQNASGLCLIEPRVTTAMHQPKMSASDHRRSRVSSGGAKDSGGLKAARQTGQEIRKSRCSCRCCRRSATCAQASASACPPPCAAARTLRDAGTGVRPRAALPRPSAPRPWPSLLRRGSGERSYPHQDVGVVNKH